MEYFKKKNLIVAVKDGVWKGSYDWTSGQFYGVGNRSVKNIPAAFRGSVYQSIISSHQWIITHLTDDALTLAQDRWERLASLGLYTFNYDMLHDSEYNFPSLKKDFVTYLHNRWNNEFSPEIYNFYEFQRNIPEYGLLNSNSQQIVKQIFFNRYYHTCCSPTEWLVPALLRLQNDDISYLHINIHDALHLLDEYYSVSIAMDEKPVITHNFLTTIAHALHSYQNWKQDHFDEALRRFNDLPYLYYENDTYIMRPLVSRADFRKEGTAQNNCVERLYMEKVAERRTHIVVIRRKDNPNQSLITCEIDNSNKILQYLAQYNNPPKAPEKEFYKELKSYLDSLPKR